jgi:hypothetical protein
MIRLYKPSDLGAIQDMHREMGMEYNFPDLSDWRFTPKVVVEENGKPVMAAALRLTSEAYFWLDKEHGEPKDRWCNLLTLHETVRQEAEAAGYSDS